jgi:hypothetical protein
VAREPTACAVQARASVAWHCHVICIAFTIFWGQLVMLCTGTDTFYYFTSSPKHLFCLPPFWPTFLKQESKVYEITMLSVCVSPPLITFERIIRVSRNWETLLCHWKWPRRHVLYCCRFQPSQNGEHSDFWGGCKTCTSQRESTKH